MLRVANTSRFLELITYMLIETTADLGEVELQQEQNKNQDYSRSWTCAYLVAVERAAGCRLQAEEDMDCILK
jgi:hypothetical protein